MNCRERLEAYLQENRVRYEVQQHPAAYTAQQIAAAEHISGKLIAKVVMAVADERMVMLVLPGHHRVDLDRAGALLGSRRFRLAQEREFGPLFPDCDIGAMPPFGHFYGIPVYVDAALADDQWIYYQVGTHTETMKVNYADYERLVRPLLLEFSRSPGTAAR